MRALHMIAFILVIIGALNWGLVAVSGEDIGQMVLGGMDQTVSRVIYALVGLAGISEVLTHGKNCRTCKPSSMGSSTM